jgi:membrane-bound lytic murein transglycosylase D
MRKKTFLPGNLNIPTSKAPNLISIFMAALLGILLLNSKTGYGKGVPDYENRIKRDSVNIDTTANAKQFAGLLPSETSSTSVAATLPAKTTTHTTTATSHTVANKKTAAPIKVGLNPHVADFARSYLSRERVDLKKMKNWGQPYFKIFDRILTQNGIPVQLKYLAVIESSLSSTLRSCKGAVGPWQLMDYEARQYGLKMGKHDERTDYVKSTEAACKLLTSLHNRYGDWLLVIAAYNGGVGAVNKAIDKAGSDDFWDIQQYLPTETRNHVKKFISTHYFFEGAGGFTTMTTGEIATYKAKAAKQKQSIVVKNTITPDLKTTTTTNLQNTINTDGTDIVKITGIYDIATICNVLNIEEKRFRELNPGFNKALANGLSYPMRLPIEKIQLFNDSKDKILETSFHKLIEDDGTTATVKN